MRKIIIALLILSLLLFGCIESKEETKQEQKICRDMCGDGVCQEIVCLGEGCPCAETKETCPKDCGN